MKPLTIRGTALSVGLFFDVTFVLCVVWGLVVPTRLETMAKIWEALLPGFTWLTPASFALACVELFLYGVYVAVVFVPLFNFFEGGRPSGVTEAMDERPVPRAAAG
ncbi:MAG: hypothetical protein HYU41_00450 [Candidatus Rokubacteria bacterium]|nr:hypothetical protein [Candidatus Rokubacteria bacterium]